jgi:molybdenum cofactor guanylyltransferase
MSTITGVILAGGRGQRLGGVDKGLMRLQGKSIIEWIIPVLTPQVANILINANRHIAEYSAYGYPVASDTLADFQGPLAGFVTAMQNVNTPYFVTVPCDAPHIAPNYVERLWRARVRDNTLVAVAHDGERLQPTHALIAVELLPNLLAFLQTGQRKIEAWYQTLQYSTVDFAEGALMFDNINTPEQLARKQRL